MPMGPVCNMTDCKNRVIKNGEICSYCKSISESKVDVVSTKYPKYYKDVTDIPAIDVYAVHQLFNIEDPSGAIQHASKKLLLSGVRTGGKTKLQDITEARDTLTRWIELNSK